MSSAILSDTNHSTSWILSVDCVPFWCEFAIWTGKLRCVWPTAIASSFDIPSARPFQIYRPIDRLLLLEISVAATAYHVLRLDIGLQPNDGERAPSLSHSPQVLNKLRLFCCFAGELDVGLWMWVVHVHPTDYSLLHGKRCANRGNSPNAKSNDDWTDDIQFHLSMLCITEPEAFGGTLECPMVPAATEVSENAPNNVASHSKQRENHNRAICRIELGDGHSRKWFASYKFVITMGRCIFYFCRFALFSLRFADDQNHLQISHDSDAFRWINRKWIYGIADSWQHV